MKAIGGLFDQITTHGNVTAAAWRAAQGKRDRREVQAFFAHLDGNIATIVQELAAGTFRFDGYHAFAIRDPKSRTIHAPSFRDRVVHHAIIAITGPVFESGAIAHSYACRAGKGQHAALDQVRAWLRRGDWFLKVDVAKYYDSLPHEPLRVKLARRFREQRLLRLFDELLESYAHSPAHGLPIGALSSQYLGNFYLDSVDHWVNEHLRLPRYCRYMVDLLLIADHATLRAARRALADQLAGLGLQMKEGGVLNACALGVPYLGFTLYPDRTRLCTAGRRRLRRKLRTAQQSGLSPSDYQAQVSSLFAHALWADDVRWRREVCRWAEHRQEVHDDA